METDADLPEWLRDAGLPNMAAQEAGEIPAGEPQDAGVPESGVTESPGEQGDLPPAASPAPPPDDQKTTHEPDLEAAALPGWLQSMRTDEGQPPEAAPSPEEAGPLAGLTGLLSADQGTSHLPGQATRPLHLKITANQRLHADLLHNLVEMEGQARPLPKRPALASQQIQRWIIAVVLILAVLWPVLMDGNPAVLDAYTEEAAELNRLVSQLSPDAKVLVAFDYEPAFAPEMEAAAAPVMDHLMLRGASLTIVSTTPTGPVLAERFLNKTLAGHQYTGGVQYINLGFIPGGAAGLLSLVEAPQRTVPYTIDGVAAWETSAAPALPPLQGVRSFEDFSMVLVLVDDPDLARIWIEQASPRQADEAKHTILTMVSSAQAEPLLNPYYLSNPRQLHGFAAGLRGGAAYARMTGRESGVQDYWDAFGVGLFVMAIILVIGAVLHASTLPGQAPAVEKDEEMP